ncbi:hypothetical protein Tsedi_01486 [Tepidimonas sediminis]|uniref:Lipoprotein n=1 Tax=Tepidimonas sediminis TaxID=2588941 RepID=A0A554WNU1_9BURK|nr:hypothetical protein [Tepidimonas sediminis]TSE25240.1 hypothetical protein Tsedi_01486 [Tepidimonas sediminis]
MRTRPIALTVGAVLAVAVLAGCERPQTATGSKSDQPPYRGSTAPAFADAGWQAGDRNAWAQHLRARAQYGQNEYSRPPGGAAQ